MKRAPLLQCSFLVGRGGFEPPKELPADLQSAPFGHSGTYPYILTVYLIWSRLSESNQQPADYKSAALPVELSRHMVPWGGIEPPTRGFSVPCSTI